ncbi:hypothetical protein L2E82_34485 [Cichorium intybus]|uniref:Uncharacterized protein n=1 Tax=Cichorium intybus TaxID=13427 RepID=A0ACB9BM86_CICIN|nr:hypothetical protein L2E82_34485 [Cichorium intybus]
MVITSTRHDRTVFLDSEEVSSFLCFGHNNELDGAKEFHLSWISHIWLTFTRMVFDNRLLKSGGNNKSITLIDGNTEIISGWG